MERLNIEDIKRYITLNDELVQIDPYQLKLTSEEFLEKYEAQLISGELEIFLFSEGAGDKGFIEVSRDGKTGMIEKIYRRPEADASEAYTHMLKELGAYFQNTGVEKLIYIGPNGNAGLARAFMDTGFIMEKEHIQMEKTLGKTNPQAAIEYKAFHEIEDKDGMFDFMKQCTEGGAFPYKKEEVADLTRVKSDLNLVLHENGQPVGILVAYINEQRNAQEQKKVVYIEEVAVLKSHRNRGFGAKAITFAENKGIEKGMEIARLHVYRHNENAHRLYEKLGFKEVKSIGFWAKTLKERA